MRWSGVGGSPGGLGDSRGLQNSGWSRRCHAPCWLGMHPKDWEGEDVLSVYPDRCGGVWAERMASVEGCGQRGGVWSPRLQSRQVKGVAMGGSPRSTRKGKTPGAEEAGDLGPMDAERPSGWSGCEGVAAGSRGPRGWHVNPGSVFTHCQANS